MRLSQLSIFVFVLLLGLSLQSCIDKANANISPVNKTYKAWSSIENAISASENNNKKIIIDVYTDWCKWCKVMDEKTFQDPSFSKYIDDNFNTAKFNAESKEPVMFNGKQYNWQDGRRNGMHQLAMDLMDNRPSYPSLIILDADLNKLQVVRGYKSPEQLKSILENI